MPAHPASVLLSRRRVTRALRADGWNNERIDDVALMTSELTTNAVEHAGTPFTLVIELSDHVLRVEVRDGSVALPVAEPTTPSPVAMRGRGLALVAALSDRWGYEPDADGKFVWFETWTRPR
jgi:serine/threonine-protein kinase RsbW